MTWIMLLGANGQLVWEIALNGFNPRISDVLRTNSPNQRHWLRYARLVQIFLELAYNKDV